MEHNSLTSTNFSLLQNYLFFTFGYYHKWYGIDAIFFSFFRTHIFSKIVHSFKHSLNIHLLCHTKRKKIVFCCLLQRNFGFFLFYVLMMASNFFLVYNHTQSLRVRFLLLADGSFPLANFPIQTIKSIRNVLSLFFFFLFLLFSYSKKKKTELKQNEHNY